MSKQKSSIAAIALLADFTIVLVITNFLLDLYHGVGTEYILAFPCIIVFMLYVLGIYRPLLVEHGVIANLASIIFSCSVGSMLVYVFMFGTDIERLKFLGLWLPAICFCLSLWRHFVESNSLFEPRKQLIACNLNQEMSEELITNLRVKKHRYNTYQFVDLEPDELKTKLHEFAGSKFSTVVVYNVDLLSDITLAETLLRLRIEGMEIVTDSEFYGAITGKIWISEQHKTFALEAALREGRSDSISVGISNIRKILNIVFGFFFLAILLVPMLIIAIMVKQTSPGPVFFRQKRLGKNKKEFTLFKFRTMVMDAEKKGPQWATKVDARVTPLGNILRELHLDELPQIINICKGDLHFVGPRPIRKYFAEQLAEQIPNYNLRFLIKPGLTGWAQTLGPYGENIVEQKEKFEFELFYIANRNQISDVMIIGLTVGKVASSVRALARGLWKSKTVKQ